MNLILLHALNWLVLCAALNVVDALTPRFCHYYPTCETCAGSLDASNNPCDWVPSRYSCVPRTGEDDFLSGLERNSAVAECNASLALTSYPSWRFRHECERGGIYTKQPNRPFGAYCDCPHNYFGSKCQICNSDTMCSAGEVCMQNVRNVPANEHREMSCDCTSPLCKQIGFGPGMGVVNVRMNFGEEQTRNTWARIDIMKAVDPPNDAGKMNSPFIIRANLTECDSGRDIPCSQACGVMQCPPEVIWTEEETCRVWDCHSAPDTKPDNYTICPPSSEPWGAYAKDCSLVQAMMLAPFQFVCVVPKDPSSPLVGGKIKCGFSTMLLPHGGISLDCSVGSCIQPVVTQAPTVPNKTKTDSIHSNIFVCSGNYGDQECWQTYYFLIMMVPIVYTLTLIIGVTAREREVRSAVHATRILRQHLSDGLSSGDNLEQGGETDEFLQSRAQSPPTSTSSSRVTNSMRYPSPVLSFQGVTFGLYDQNAEQDTPGRRRSYIRNRRRGFRTVLHSVSGHVRSGEICAILGPSGSGKTSLIDILAGRKNVGRLAGTVSLDGHPASSSELKEKVGYVTQDDVLPSTSTVRECLLFHAALRGNCTMPLLSRCERVEDVLEELGLANCANSLVGGPDYKSISGGERRRVSIACELLGENNQLLVMDEPTSGLDSNSTQSVINSLQAVVERERRTVILSIHQPSTALFRKFNRVILLSATGRCLFCGPATALETFFPAFPLGCNPAEHLIDMAVGGRDAEELHRQGEERFDASIVRQEQISELRSLIDQVHSQRDPNVGRPAVHIPTWKRQFIELSSRSVRNAWRHPVLAMTNVVATLCVATSCGLLYRGVTNDLQGAINRAGLFFFFLCFLMLASVADLQVFQEERLMLMRERASGTYGTSAYFAAKIFAEIFPLRVAPLSITAFLLTFTVGLNPHPQAVFFMDILLLCISTVATLQFLCLGMLFPKAGVATFAAILVTMFSLLMSGFLLQFDGTGGGQGANNDPPMTSGFEWMQSFSVLHFGFEALMVNELHGITFTVVIRNPDGTEITKVTASGDLILAQLGFLHERFARDVGYVLFYFFFFGAFALLLLEFVVVERR